MTALYELVPAGKEESLPDVEDLEFQKPAAAAPGEPRQESLIVKLRYKQPDGDDEQADQARRGR